jgi:hypothetical protein
VRAVVDPRKLSWVEVSVHDLATRTATFRMDADHYADRFRCAQEGLAAALPGLHVELEKLR